MKMAAEIGLIHPEAKEHLRLLANTRGLERGMGQIILHLPPKEKQPLISDF